jgi:hypothetical protein
MIVRARDCYRFMDRCILTRNGNNSGNSCAEQVLSSEALENCCSVRVHTTRSVDCPEPV